MRADGVADGQPQIATFQVGFWRTLRASQILSRPPPMYDRCDHVLSRGWLGLDSTNDVRRRCEISRTCLLARHTISVLVASSSLGSARRVRKSDDLGARAVGKCRQVFRRRCQWPPCGPQQKTSTTATANAHYLALRYSRALEFSLLSGKVRQRCPLRRMRIVTAQTAFASVHRAKAAIAGSAGLGRGFCAQGSGTGFALAFWAGIWEALAGPGEPDRRPGLGP
jgi:hypothetical protein